MITYKKDLPLAFIHVPKTAGTSLRSIFKDWYGDKFYLHYPMPEIKINSLRSAFDYFIKEKLLSRHSNPGIRHNPKLFHLERETCVFGHFNNNEGFGVKKRYPEVKQYITFLRNPFDTMVSDYYYVRKKGKNWNPTPPQLRMSLEEFLFSKQHNFLNHLPIKDYNNVRKELNSSFIHIGVTEKMETSLSIIANKLNKPIPNTVPHHNAGDRPALLNSDLRREYRNKNELIYSIYEYALSLN